MSKNDGGPAFPVDGEYHGADWYPGGMCLRDWFAGQALAGRVLHPKALDKKAIGDDELAACIAEAMYVLADAMIAERAKSDG